MEPLLYHKLMQEAIGCRVVLEKAKRQGVHHLNYPIQHYVLLTLHGKGQQVFVLILRMTWGIALALLPKQL